MALPKRRSAKTFTPVLKFDARTGVFVRIDRKQDDSGGWKSDPHEIPYDDVEFVADLPNLQIGWISFGGNGTPPDFRMVSVDQDVGDKPGDAYKEGFRLRLRLGESAGGDTRELASTALGIWRSVDELHCAYEKGASNKANKDKLPLLLVWTRSSQWREKRPRSGRVSKY